MLLVSPVFFVLRQVKAPAVNKAFFGMLTKRLSCCCCFPKTILTKLLTRRQSGRKSSMSVWLHYYFWEEISSYPITAPHSSLRLPHLDMCFGLVEQSQSGMPTAVWSQRNEGLQPLQAQTKMCSPVNDIEQSALFNIIHEQKTDWWICTVIYSFALILIRSDYYLLIQFDLYLIRKSKNYLIVPHQFYSGWWVM